MKQIEIGRILFLLASILTACSTNNSRSTITFTFTPTALSRATEYQVTPTLIPLPSPNPSITPSFTLTDTNPYHLAPSQLSQLGSVTEPFVAKRQIVIQRFERGVMLIAAQAGDVFDPHGGGFIFALATDGRAWRVRDTFVETSKNPDDWYTCERKPGLRPERSGIPWRGFGKAWCDHPEVRDALGFAKTYENSETNASFQSYERGCAIQVFDWKGYPGWKTDHVYLLYYSSFSNPNFVSGNWE